MQIELVMSAKSLIYCLVNMTTRVKVTWPCIELGISWEHWNIQRFRQLGDYTCNFKLIYYNKYNILKLKLYSFKILLR